MTKPNMTKTECLQKMVILWRYLSKASNILVPIDIREAYQRLHLSFDLRNCPCCEYTSKGTVHHCLQCYLCPLLSLWPKQGRGYWVNYPCEEPGSIYSLWYSPQDNSIVLQQQAAKEIADYSENLLHKLEEQDRD